MVALLSAYRYEGTKVKDDTAKSEAKILSNAIKNAHKKPINEDDEVIRILATRSKLHLQAVYKHYKEISGKNLDEVLNTTDAPYILVTFEVLYFYYKFIIII